MIDWVEEIMYECVNHIPLWQAGISYSAVDEDWSLAGLNAVPSVIDVSEKHGTHLRIGTSCVFFGRVKIGPKECQLFKEGCA